MMDDFLFRAILGGVLLAVVCGPFGAFIVWRRMAFFGDMLAHTALLGVALGLLIGVDIRIGMIATCLVAALLLSYGQRQARIGSDTVLGMLAHSTLALGMVALAFVQGVAVDLMAYLFGDILAINTGDILLLAVGGAFAFCVLAWMWRPLLALTVSPEIAAAEGIPVERLRLVFMLLMALVIGMAIKIVGVLLITALLIVPAASARFFARTPEQMAIGAGLFGAASVLAGISLSWHVDTPAGPSIVISAAAIFILSAGFAPVMRKLTSGA
ncbi:iron chelate uptake ABC transporter family permease subunit [Thalassospira sp.]|uniref:iron chelate uptake ABC transporter family permease subunit n=1 Tax=Thalassospira sp. TaxID=1912094 RepID=UPI001B1DD5DA|nr:iron chelate uptake ABC transporter family permease subunit [Thalassospira sp.]MBO6807526.1 metal ABC transporter permease [Thalassospira sp.]MBO6840051.1 metal ABC transporter permease [Thalassospira sp.]